MNEEFVRAGIVSPAKLNVQCVDGAFEEMRRDGFADDGLFGQMKIFFLPLTLIENDLHIDDQRWKNISRIRLKERNDLLV